MVKNLYADGSLGREGIHCSLNRKQCSGCCRAVFNDTPLQHCVEFGDIASALADQVIWSPFSRSFRENTLLSLSRKLYASIVCPLVEFGSRKSKAVSVLVVGHWTNPLKVMRKCMGVYPTTLHVFCGLGKGN